MVAGKYKSFINIFTRPAAISIWGTLISRFVLLAEKYKKRFTRRAAIRIWGTFCVRKSTV